MEWRNYPVRKSKFCCASSKIGYQGSTQAYRESCLLTPPFLILRTFSKLRIRAKIWILMCSVYEPWGMWHMNDKAAAEGSVWMIQGSVCITCCRRMERKSSCSWTNCICCKRKPCLLMGQSGLFSASFQLPHLHIQAGLLWSPPFKMVLIWEVSAALQHGVRGTLLGPLFFHLAQPCCRCSTAPRTC